MAYTLKYYKEIEQGGKRYRLDIYKKNGTGSAMEIGNVLQGLSLEIQGQQDDIDAPIVKTSLSMAFVDAYDLENGKKNGLWEEFYTPDALAWKVNLLEFDGVDAWDLQWSGFVTPDSFSENLTYRGSVNIVARDNIGYMQDFPFDIEADDDGMISLRDIVTTAFQRASVEMSVVFDDGWMTTENGTSALYTLMNISAFEGKNWYDVLNDALYAYGAVLRYAGWAEFYVMPLHRLPYMGFSDYGSIPRTIPQFITGATREMVPAVKRIEESVGYELVEGRPFDMLGAFSGSYTYPCSVDVVNEKGKVKHTASSTAPVNSVSNTGKGWQNVPTSTLFFNANSLEMSSLYGVSGIESNMYVAANNTDARSVYYDQSIWCADFVIKIALGVPIAIGQGLNDTNKIRFAASHNGKPALRKAVFFIYAEQNGVVQYYRESGVWGASYAEINKEYDILSETNEITFPISMKGLTGAAKLRFGIVNLDYVFVIDETYGAYGTYEHKGLYACIENISFLPSANKALCSKNNINLNYKQENNVILSRDPKLAPALDSVLFPQYIKNGIFEKVGDSIAPTRTWKITSSLSSQMSVGIQMALIAYYAKPNNLITGEIVNSGLRYDQLYKWNGVDHMLVSGTFNYLNGRIEGAVLREFALFDTIWNGASGSLTPDIEQGSSTNKDSGASGGSAGGGGGSYGSSSPNYWKKEQDGAIHTYQDVYIEGDLVVEGDVSASDNNASTGSGSSSGSKVTYTPTVTSGTQLGVITIDGSAKSIYAPTISKSDVGLGNVANSTYAGGTSVTLNGVSKASSTAAFFAPTTSGSDGQVLVSGGSGAPQWMNIHAAIEMDGLSGAAVVIPNGYHTGYCRSNLQLNLKNFKPKDVGAACTIIITKTGSYTINIPVVATSGVRYINPSTGAIATAASTIGAYYGLILVWNIGNQQWDAFRI